MRLTDSLVDSVSETNMSSETPAPPRRSSLHNLSSSVRTPFGGICLRPAREPLRHTLPVCNYIQNRTKSHFSPGFYLSVLPSTPVNLGPRRRAVGETGSFLYVEANVRCFSSFLCLLCAPVIYLRSKNSCCPG